jgi:hypothetical protein
MTPFNGSLAKNVSIVADQIIQAQLMMFLVDPSRAVDITDPARRIDSCSYGPSAYTGVPCERSFFMAGVEFTPRFLEYTKSATNVAEVILATNQQGYVLDYKEYPGNLEFDLETECQIYGFPFAAFHLCLRNIAENILHARKCSLHAH